MRYVLIDRITSLDRGRALRAVKNVSVSDDLVTRYGPGFSALPGTMVLEAMAQAAGLLVAATIDARAQPVLAKVQPFTAYGDAVPGDQVWLDAALEDLRDEGCRARVRATVGDRAIADATIYLAFVPLDAGGAPRRAGQLRACLADTFPGWFNTAEVAEIES